MWKPHKPTVDRQNPPPLRDTLESPGAVRRLHKTIAELIESSPVMSIDTFVDYLAFQSDSGRVDYEGERVWGFDKAARLELHIEHVVSDSVRFARFLDFFAQYCVVTSEKKPLIIPPESTWTAHVAHRVNAVNDCLKNESLVFRIEPGSVYGFAVHKLGTYAMDKQVVRLALELCASNEMIDALKEYEEALGAWAKGKTDDAVRQASHAVETTMKTILKDLGAVIRPDATPSALIKAIVDAKLIPEKYSHFWNQLSMGIQGVITIRNEAPGAGHGPAPGVVGPDDATAEYAINMAGGNIVFLVRRWRALRDRRD